MKDRPHILVLADDLSGAADCSVAWTRQGDRTVVALNATDTGGGTAVLALDMNSRNLSADDAGATAMHAVEICGGLASRILYQKMDSALRGNWAAELAAIRSALGRRTGSAPLAIVAPALPSAGRAVVDGRGLIHGDPLEESAIWRDAGIPGPADLRGIMARRGLEARLVPLAAVRAGAGALEASFREFAAQRVPAVVCDAERDEDLAAIAAAAYCVPGCVWVGSAGLMHALVTAMGMPQQAAQRSPLTVGSRPLLAIVGSASHVSHRQFGALSQEPSVVPLQVPVQDLLSGMAGAPVGQALEDAFCAGMDAAVAVAPGRGAAPADGSRITAALGALMAPHLARVGGVVMTGGETARAILDAAGVRRLEVLCEVEPGVPLCRTEGTAPILAVTKSGSFGDDRTLVRCRNTLRGRRPEGDDRPVGAADSGGMNA